VTLLGIHRKKYGELEAAGGAGKKVVSSRIGKRNEPCLSPLPWSSTPRGEKGEGARHLIRSIRGNGLGVSGVAGTRGKKQYLAKRGGSARDRPEKMPREKGTR